MHTHAAMVAGPMRAWRTLSLNFRGPLVAEASTTYRDYRLSVALREARTGDELRIEGFFAADGLAADSCAASGDVWRAAFTPPSEGEWIYSASFRHGEDVALVEDPKAGEPIEIVDGANGRLLIAPAERTENHRDMRGLGPIALARAHYEFLRSGARAQERLASIDPTFLSSSDFDTYADGSSAVSEPVKKVAETAWRATDPSWADGRGRRVIGALNVAASAGATGLLVRALAAQGDPGKTLGASALRVSPYGPASEVSEAQGATRPHGASLATDCFDVSRLAQWEILFAHAQTLGLVVNLDLRPPAPFATDDERALFVREMSARFAHHNGLIWRLPPDDPSAALLRALDPYRRPIAPPPALDLRRRPADGADPAPSAPSMETAAFQTSFTAMAESERRNPEITDQLESLKTTLDWPDALADADDPARSAEPPKRAADRSGPPRRWPAAPDAAQGDLSDAPSDGATYGGAPTPQKPAAGWASDLEPGTGSGVRIELYVLDTAAAKPALAPISPDDVLAADEFNDGAIALIARVARDAGGAAQFVRLSVDETSWSRTEFIEEAAVFEEVGLSLLNELDASGLGAITLCVDALRDANEGATFAATPLATSRWTLSRDASGAAPSRSIPA